MPSQSIPDLITRNYHIFLKIAMFSITIASFADVNILNQYAATNFWKGRVALWVLVYVVVEACLSTSHFTCHSLLAAPYAQHNPLLSIHFASPSPETSAQTGSSQVSSVLSASLFSADRTAPYHSACLAQVWLSCSNVLKASTQATEYSSTNSTMWRAGSPNIIFWFGNVTPKETDNGVGKKKPWDFWRLTSPL